MQEYGAISILKGQGQKSVLDACDLWAQHHIKISHDSVMEIAARAQEYFQKLLPVNAVHCAIQMQFKALLCREKEHREMLLSSLGHSPFKMD